MLNNLDLTVKMPGAQPQSLPPGGSCRRRKAVTEEECGQKFYDEGNFSGLFLGRILQEV